jgi:hypothetical protein
MGLSWVRATLSNYWSKVILRLEDDSLLKIAREIPPELVEAYEKKGSYSFAEIKTVFEQEFKKTRHLKYAYAAFSSEQCFDQQAKHHDISETYAQLRQAVADKCFSGWPRFNFDSFLALSESNDFVGGGGDGGGC